MQAYRLSFGKRTIAIEKNPFAEAIYLQTIYINTKVPG